MAFKASKTRQRRVQPIAKGKTLNTSAPIKDWYQGVFSGLLQEMSDDYKRELDALMATPGVEQHYTADASLPISRFKKLFSRLFDRWMAKVGRVVDRNARKCAVKIDQHSHSSVGASLKAVGMKEPKNIAKSEWEKQMELYTQENVALIKSIAQKFHSDIEKATWNSLTSEKGDEQGAYGLNKYLYEKTTASKEKAQFIARDQTSKLNSVLNNARMEQNGLTSFDWMHSSAGKEPRLCHVKWNGRRFLTKGGPSELYELLPDGTIVEVTVGYDGARKGDIGKPGYCINCKCRARPVLDL